MTAPVPPPGLPPARLVNVPTRGEMFVREHEASGPTIALLHGWAVSADTNWFRAYEELARTGARVVALDHRGHGRGLRSDDRFTLEDAADDVAATLREMDAAPAVVVGYSMGGPIALLTWLRHPDVVRGLVLEATSMEWRANAYERFLWRFVAAVEVFFRIGRPKGVIERTLRRMAKKAPELEAVLPWLRGELRRGDPAALADAGRALSAYDFRPHAGRIDVPTAVVVTTKDRLVRVRKQRALAAAIPDAKVFELAADHDAPLVAPEFGRVTADAVAAVTGVGGYDEVDSPRRRTAG